MRTIHRNSTRGPIATDGPVAEAGNPELAHVHALYPAGSAGTAVPATPALGFTGGRSTGVRGADAAVRGIRRLVNAFQASNDKLGAGATAPYAAGHSPDVRGAEAAARAIDAFAGALRRSGESSSRKAVAAVPMSGGPKGALARRGAEAAAEAVPQRDRDAA